MTAPVTFAELIERLVTEVDTGNWQEAAAIQAEISRRLGQLEGLALADAADNRGYRSALRLLNQGISG